MHIFCMVLHCTESTAEGNLAAGETGLLLSVMRKKIHVHTEFFIKENWT